MEKFKFAENFSEKIAVRGTKKPAKKLSRRNGNRFIKEVFLMNPEILPQDEVRPFLR